MTYEELRDQVLDGDLVAVRSSRSLLGKVTRWVTKSPYTHTAVALWLEGGLWIAQMDGIQNALVPLSQYSDTPFDVYRCPVPRDAIRQAVLEQLRLKVRYGWADIAYIGLHRVLGVPLPPEDDDFVCSSYSAAAYIAAGWGARLPSICAPADVVAALRAAPALVNHP